MRTCAHIIHSIRGHARVHTLFVYRYTRLGESFPTKTPARNLCSLSVAGRGRRTPRGPTPDRGRFILRPREHRRSCVRRGGSAFLRPNGCAAIYIVRVCTRRQDHRGRKGVTRARSGGEESQQTATRRRTMHTIYYILQQTPGLIAAHGLPRLLR